MQLLAPEMQAIQKKYKGKTDPASREAMSRETMELYRKHGTNPFASCLPILLQSPIFFALFRVLNSPAARSAERRRPDPIGPMTQELAASGRDATIFGAPLSGTFMQADGNVHIQIVSVVLIIAMSATTFLTQRQLTMKNMPPAALQGPMAQQQKMLLYVLPLIFAFSGVNFPIGVLIYWTTTNLWSMGQQFYTIRRMPAPGSAGRAARSRSARRRKAAAQGRSLEDDATPAVIEEKPRSGQRQQPKRKDRAKPRPAGATGPPAAEPGIAEDSRSRRRRRAPSPSRPPSPRSSHRTVDRRALHDLNRRQTPPPSPRARKRLEEEGEIAADYLEELLDIADLDGDIDIDVDHGRAAVEIVSEDPADRSLRAPRRRATARCSTRCRSSPASPCRPRRVSGAGSCSTSPATGPRAGPSSSTVATEAIAQRQGVRCVRRARRR